MTKRNLPILITYDLLKSRTKNPNDKEAWILYSEELLSQGFTKLYLYKSLSSKSIYVSTKINNRSFEARFSDHKANRDNCSDYCFDTNNGNVKDVIKFFYLWHYVFNNNTESLQKMLHNAKIKSMKTQNTQKMTDREIIQYPRAALGNVIIEAVSKLWAKIRNK